MGSLISSTRFNLPLLSFFSTSSFAHVRMMNEFVNNLMKLFLFAIWGEFRGFVTIGKLREEKDKKIELKRQSRQRERTLMS